MQHDAVSTRYLEQAKRHGFYGLSVILIGAEQLLRSTRSRTEMVLQRFRRNAIAGRRAVNADLAMKTRTGGTVRRQLSQEFDRIHFLDQSPIDAFQTMRLRRESFDLSQGVVDLTFNGKSHDIAPCAGR